MRVLCYYSIYWNTTPIRFILLQNREKLMFVFFIAISILH